MITSEDLALMGDDDEQLADDGFSPVPKDAVSNTGSEVVIDVAALLGAEKQATLVHQGERYRLRITARGKLILTK